LVYDTSIMILALPCNRGFTGNDDGLHTIYAKIVREPRKFPLCWHHGPGTMCTLL